MTDTCTASYAADSPTWGAIAHCAQAADHYRMPDSPHETSPDADGNTLMWPDSADGATPHTPAAEEPAATPASPGPWKLEHQLHYINQIETRAGAPKDGGPQWAEQRLTGLATVVCNCGYTCGWAPLQQLIEDYPHVTKAG